MKETTHDSTTSNDGNLTRDSITSNDRDLASEQVGIVQKLLKVQQEVSMLLQANKRQAAHLDGLQNTMNAKLHASNISLDREWDKSHLKPK